MIPPLKVPKRNQSNKLNHKVACLAVGSEETNSNRMTKMMIPTIADHI